MHRRGVCHRLGDAVSGRRGRASCGPAVWLAICLQIGGWGCGSREPAIGERAARPPRPVAARDGSTSAEGTPLAVPSTIRLRNASETSGITFRHVDGSSGRRYIIETMSAGLALFDYDRDGAVDIHFPNGAELPGVRYDAPPQDALYRNQGDGTFRDVTAHAGVGDVGFGLGVAVGDYDNDGDPDLFLNNAGPNVLYRNNGDGTFRDVTARAGVAGGDKVGAGACFLDMDGDGDLDLYVANYVQLAFDAHQSLVISGVPTYPGPLDYLPEADQLYRNNGDGTFTDVSVQAGVAHRAATGMGMTCLDYDADGDTDIYVANDNMANFLFQNDGRGKFREVGIPAGVALDGNGTPQASMGAEAGDWDNDGWLDLQVTAYQNQMPTLYRNQGTGFFLDATRPANAAAGTSHAVMWGNGLVDFDNDGDRDLFLACGHTDDNIELRDKHASYHERNLLLMNTGRGKFVNVSDRSGDGLDVKLASRGAAFDDLDNDGRVDAVILNSRSAPTVLRNESPGRQHWLQVQLVGVASNRDGVGAQVKLQAGDVTWVDEVHSGRGYQSHYGSRLHFGLGSRPRVNRIEVRWIGGGCDVVEQVAGDQRVTIVEGSARPSRSP
jgi:enediyne biosynthesis protein E4